jgi:tetratricopeptide (TPR) repeat protein
MDPSPVDKLHLLLRLGRYAEAGRAAREVIAEDPESGSGYYFLAQALLCLDRYPEALDVSDRVLALAPNEWFAHTQRSALLQAVGRLTEAVGAAETAMRLDHTEPAVHLRLASALSAAGRGGEGDAVISAARHQFPDNPDVVFQVGLVALGREDMDAVAEAAQRGLALDPTNPGFHLLAGLVAGHRALHQVPEGPMRQGRFREAERLLAEAVRMNPTNPAFRKLRKNNARDSRDDFIARLMTGWLFGMVLGVVVLPLVLREAALPCWCWVVLPLAVWLLGVITHARCPEFSLVMPLGRLDVVAVPLLPEERRKGLALCFVFLAATAAALFLPTMLMPAGVRAPDTQPTRRDGGPRPPVPAKGKPHAR